MRAEHSGQVRIGEMALAHLRLMWLLLQLHDLLPGLLKAPLQVCQGSPQLLCCGVSLLHLAALALGGVLLQHNF